MGKSSHTSVQQHSTLFACAGRTRDSYSRWKSTAEDELSELPGGQVRGRVGQFVEACWTMDTKMVYSPTLIILGQLFRYIVVEAIKRAIGLLNKSAVSLAVAQ